jgi:hypothetical protein
MTNFIIEAPVRGRAEATIAMVSPELLARLAGMSRTAQEDAAMDAEDILTQAEEANALDPVG